MKTLNIITAALLTMGIVGAGVGCGSSSTGGNVVDSSLNSLPNANLSVSNVGDAAGQVIDTGTNKPPAGVSDIISSGQEIPMLSYALKNPGSLVVKPQSMKPTTLKLLSDLKLAQTSGDSCTPIVTNNSGDTSSGTIDETLTWKNVSCSMESFTMTIDGSVAIKGNYNKITGNVSINTSVDLTVGETFSGSSSEILFKGNDYQNATGLVPNTQSIGYTHKGRLNISGNITDTTQYNQCGNTATGSFSAWYVTDTSFSGSPSKLSLTGVIGSEENISAMTSGGGSLQIKSGNYAKTAMTIDIASPTTRTVNGSGTFGRAFTGTGVATCEATVASSTSYSGKFTAKLSSVKFDDTLCNGKWPTGGTLTLKANHTLKLDFSGFPDQCGCANISIDGGQAQQNCKFKW